MHRRRCQRGSWRARVWTLAHVLRRLARPQVACENFPTKWPCPQRCRSPGQRRARRASRRPHRSQRACLDPRLLPSHPLRAGGTRQNESRLHPRASVRGWRAVRVRLGRSRRAESMLCRRRPIRHRRCPVLVRSITWRPRRPCWNSMTGPLCLISATPCLAGCTLTRIGHPTCRPRWKRSGRPLLRASP